MGGVGHFIPSRVPKLIPRPISVPTTSAKRNHEFPMGHTLRHGSPKRQKNGRKHLERNRNGFFDFNIPVQKKETKRRLITVSIPGGRGHEKWNCDYTFSLQELQLHDLSDYDTPRDSNVSISLCLQKHAGLGLSVEGRIATCFARKCCNCCSPYLKEINTTFNVWILSSSRQIRDSSCQLPIIGGDDHSVIFVKRGQEADLGSLVQETIRLATSVNACSESCEKSEPKLLDFGDAAPTPNEKTWHKLLELKKKLHLT